MAKRTKKNSKSARSLLKLEALEQRQLLAGGFTDAQGQQWQDIVHSNGNVYDQVLLKSSSITVNADAGQVTRVSFLDQQGDVVQAEFSGAGTLTIALDPDTYVGPTEAANYVQPGVKYVQGLASFTIQGSDSTTNFSVFSVGKNNASNQALFDTTHTGGNHMAEVQRVTIVADPSNPNGSIMGGIRAANAVFTGESGVVGITAANVQVQNLVRVGDIDAKGSATPALVFGANSQFGSVDVAGGDLVQTNGKSINNSGSYGYQIGSIANVDSAGTALTAKSITAAQVTFTDANPLQAVSKTFTLGAGIDTVLGTGGDDKINGVNATDLSALDNIDGAAGNDTLSLAATAAISLPASATVKNVETAVITSGASVDGDTSAWTGLTNLTVVSNTAAATSTVTAPSTADVVYSNSSSFTGAGTGGDITISGGKTVSVTSTIAETTVNTTAIGSKIIVNGTAATTSVTVNQTAPATAAADKVGITNGALDINGNEGNLTTVSISNYGTGSDIASKGLTNLTLAGKGGTLNIAGNTQTVLNLTTNGADVGAITDAANKYQTINVTTTGSGKIANIAATAVTAINVSGDKALTLSSTAGLTGLKTITVTGAASVSADVAGLSSVTGVDASASTGGNSVTLDVTKATFAGGSGADTVTIAAAPTKTISGGAGTDTIVVNVAGATVGVLADNLKVSGFENLKLGAAATGTYDASGFTSLSHGGLTGAVVYSNVAIGTPLTITAAPGQTATYTVKGGGGDADVLPLTIKSDAGIAANTLTADNIETVEITNTDSKTDAANVNTLTLTAAQAKTIKVTGNAGLTLTATGSTKVTNFDASAISGSDSAVTYTSLNATANAAVSISGGAGADVLTGTAQAVDTIVGGAGDDTISGAGNLDVLTGGGGDDTFLTAMNSSGNIYTTISDFSSGDKLNLSAVSVGGAIADVAALGAKITLAPTAAFADYLNAAASGHGAAATNAVASWFQYNGDTYIVVDNNNADVFTSSGTTGDQVIRLSGQIEMKDAKITAEVVTL